jgi:predicted esterase
MPWLARLALPCLIFGAVASASPARAQDTPPGRIIEKVICANDPAQSYALYLPSGYSEDRAWPVLYAFDAGARGPLPVQRFRDAAERYGYILVGSNNSRNGPVAIANDALRAILADTTARFSTDPRRVYLAGFSGGARVAVLAAMALGERAAGVIGCSGGFPTGAQPSASTTFAYFGTTGTDDFNYPEMRRLDEALSKLGLAHRLDVFEGGHDWPPPEVCTRAIEWMEVRAMRTKARPRDEELLDRIVASRAADAAAEEKADRVYQAYSRYSALAATFAGLRDVTPYEQKARQLAASREVRRALAEETGSMERQMTADARISALTDEALAGEDRASAASQLLDALASLKSQSERPANDATRMAARRVLVSSWIHLNEATAGDLERGDFTRAVARLSLMARIRPDNARVDYALARAYARDGKKNAAIRALESSVRKGFTDLAAIEAEPDFESLRGEEGFRRIVAKLRAPLAIPDATLQQMSISLSAGGTPALQARQVSCIPSAAGSSNSARVAPRERAGSWRCRTSPRGRCPAI